MLWQHHARTASSTLSASQTSSAHGIHCMQVSSSSRSRSMPVFAVCLLAQQKLLQFHYRATQLRLLLTHCMLTGTHSSRRSPIHDALSATVHAHPVVCTGLKGRPAGWQSPSPLVSPRNLKAAVAALSPRAATPPRQLKAAAVAEAAALLHQQQQQQDGTQRRRDSVRTGSPRGASPVAAAAAAVATGSTSSSKSQPGLRVLGGPTPTSTAAPAAAGAAGAASSSAAAQQQQQEVASARPAQPRPVTSPFAAASAMSRDASMWVNFSSAGGRAGLQVG